MLCVFCKIKHSFTLYLSTLYLSLVSHCTDPQTHRLDHVLKFPEFSGQVGISRIPSKIADRKITNLSGKHSFTQLVS